MNRKEIIEHFTGLAEMTGKPLKTENTSPGLRVIHAGHSVILPPRRYKIRSVGFFERKLGLRPLKLSRT